MQRVGGRPWDWNSDGVAHFEDLRNRLLADQERAESLPKGSATTAVYVVWLFGGRTSCGADSLHSVRDARRLFAGRPDAGGDRLIAVRPEARADSDRQTEKGSASLSQKVEHQVSAPSSDLVSSLRPSEGAESRAKRGFVCHRVGPLLKVRVDRARDPSRIE